MEDLTYVINSDKELLFPDQPNPNDPVQVSSYISNYLRTTISKGYTKFVSVIKITKSSIIFFQAPQTLLLDPREIPFLNWQGTCLM